MWKRDKQLFGINDPTTIYTNRETNQIVDFKHVLKYRSQYTIIVTAWSNKLCSMVTANFTWHQNGIKNYVSPNYGNV